MERLLFFRSPGTQSADGECQRFVVLNCPISTTTHLSIVCTTAFYKAINLATAIQEFVSSSFGAQPRGFVRGLRVKAMHLGYKKTVRGIANQTARQFKFKSDDYGEVTVEQYFLKSEPIYCSYWQY